MEGDGVMKIDVYVNPSKLVELAEKDLGVSYEFLSCSLKPTTCLTEKITVDAKRLRNSTVFGLQVLYVTR